MTEVAVSQAGGQPGDLGGEASQPAGPAPSRRAAADEPALQGRGGLGCHQGKGLGCCSGWGVGSAPGGPGRWGPRMGEPQCRGGWASWQEGWLPWGASAGCPRLGQPAKENILWAPRGGRDRICTSLQSGGGFLQGTKEVGSRGPEQGRSTQLPPASRPWVWEMSAQPLTTDKTPLIWPWDGLSFSASLPLLKKRELA